MSTILQTSMPNGPGVAQYDVKRKFFDTIGIDSSTLPSKVPAHDLMAMNKQYIHTRGKGDSTFQEKLKYDPDADRRYAPKSREGQAPRRYAPKSREGQAPIRRRNTKKRKCLSFHETVDVVPIPMRTEYNNRVRSRLWSSAMELQENAIRNSVEFASEGWNWRDVLEDERMYVCVATSELIHPCHYQQMHPHGFR